MIVIGLENNNPYQNLYSLSGYASQDSVIVTIGNSTVTGVFNTFWEERPSGLVTP